MNAAPAKNPLPRAARVARPRCRQSGVAAVELALISILMLTLLLGAFDFGRLMHWGVSLTQAAAAGAQFGSRTTTDAANTSAITAAVHNDWGNLGGITPAVSVSQYCTCASDVVVNCSTSGVCGTYGTPRLYLVVSTSTTFQTLVPFPGIPSSVPLTRTATFRVQ
jgi:Flp pilus assembly protein TadG